MFWLGAWELLDVDTVRLGLLRKTPLRDWGFTLGGMLGLMLLDKWCARRLSPSRGCYIWQSQSPCHAPPTSLNSSHWFCSAQAELHHARLSAAVRARGAVKCSCCALWKQSPAFTHDPPPLPVPLPSARARAAAPVRCAAGGAVRGEASSAKRHAVRLLWHCQTRVCARCT